MIQKNDRTSLHITQSVIKLSDITKVFPVGGDNITALDSINLTIQNGEFVSVVGRSGSGKSTLMNMITGIDHPTSGDVVVMGTRTHHLPENTMAAWRGKNLGIVFQFYQLIPALSVIDNVLLPIQLVTPNLKKKDTDRAKNLLQAVDLWDKKDKFPAQLSGGEQQRAAVARAMANDPPILIADEPTGNLSSSEARSVMAVLENMVSAGKSVIFVTHDLELAGKARRMVTLADGRIIRDSTINRISKKKTVRKK